MEIKNKQDNDDFELTAAAYEAKLARLGAMLYDKAEAYIALEQERDELAAKVKELENQLKEKTK